MELKSNFKPNTRSWRSCFLPHHRLQTTENMAAIAGFARSFSWKYCFTGTRKRVSSHLSSRSEGFPWVVRNKSFLMWKRRCFVQANNIPEASVLSLRRDQVPCCHNFCYPSAENFRPRDLFLMGRNVGVLLTFGKAKCMKSCRKTRYLSPCDVFYISWREKRGSAICLKVKEISEFWDENMRRTYMCF